MIVVYKIALSTPLKHVSRYYLIFCTLSLFCPLASAVPKLPPILRPIFSSLSSFYTWSQTVYFSWHGGSSLTFCINLLSPDSKTIISHSDPPVLSDRKKYWILVRISTSQLVPYIRKELLLYSEKVAHLHRRGIMHWFIYNTNGVAHIGGFCNKVLTTWGPSS